MPDTPICKVASERRRKKNAGFAVRLMSTPPAIYLSADDGNAARACRRKEVVAGRRAASIV